MDYRAVLTGAGLLIAFASCEAPDGSGLFRPLVGARVSANQPASNAAGAGGNGAMPEAVSVPLDAGGDIVEGQGGALGLVGAAGSGAREPVSQLSDAGSVDIQDAGAPADAAPPSPSQPPEPPQPPPPPPPCSNNVELCDGLDNDCDDVVDEGTACAPDCAGFALEGRGYMFCSNSVVRDVAADRCELEGMRLAWIETEAENEFLVASIAAADVPAPDDDEVLTFIGASDSGNEGNWIWRGRGAIPNGFQFWQGAAGGNAVNGQYENWSPGEPNNSQNDENCGVLSVFGNNNRAPGNWDDRDCDSELPFVCEVP